MHHRRIQQQLPAYTELSDVLRGQLGFEEGAGDMWVNEQGLLVNLSQSNPKIHGLDAHTNLRWKPIEDAYKGGPEKLGVGERRSAHLRR